MVDEIGTVHALSGVVVILLVDYLARHRTWGWLQLAQGAMSFRGTPGLLFIKVMGSGHEGGFSLRPSPSHQGLVCLFEDQAKADAFVTGHKVKTFVTRSRGHWLGTLAITSARGLWDNNTIAPTPSECLNLPFATDRSDSGLVAVLTRASIRPVKAMSFWRFAPGTQSDIKRASGCQLAMGLGEVPLFRQCTFSLWDCTASMLSYAHQGTHRQAIVAAHKNDYFAESMFLRMRVLAMGGCWQGTDFGQTPEANHAR